MGSNEGCKVAELADLQQELKKLIVESLALEDVRPEDIQTGEPLFVEGLGLDSIDALEISMVVEERYGVEFGEDPDRNREIFQSVQTLSEFVAAKRSDRAG
jgi:acyl carrier protein